MWLERCGDWPESRQNKDLPAGLNEGESHVMEGLVEQVHDRWGSWEGFARTVGMPSLRTPPSGFSISTRHTGWGWYVPIRSWSRIAGQRSLR